MKYLTLILLGVIACKSSSNDADKQPLQLPIDFKVMSGDTSLHNANGTWLHKGKPFEGYIVEYKDSLLIGELPIINGKENGTAKGWYEKGKLRYERGFLNGNREGKDKGWYKNGNLAFEYNFKNDKYEGPQKTYYESGNKWQLLNYKEGYEDGKQKAWGDDGRVVNNFTVKNGKLYGVIGRYDCMSVYKK